MSFVSLVCEVAISHASHTQPCQPRWCARGNKQVCKLCTCSRDEHYNTELVCEAGEDCRKNICIFKQINCGVNARFVRSIHTAALSLQPGQLGCPLAFAISKCECWACRGTWLQPTVALLPWVSYLSDLIHNFSSCKIGMVTVPQVVLKRRKNLELLCRTFVKPL